MSISSFDVMLAAWEKDATRAHDNAEYSLEIDPGELRDIIAALRAAESARDVMAAELAELRGEVGRLNIVLAGRPRAVPRDQRVAELESCLADVAQWATDAMKQPVIQYGSLIFILNRIGRAAEGAR